MVNSYTALRTHISTHYGKSAKLVRGTHNGLFVQLDRTECSQQDIVCYDCLPVEGGVIFSLDAVGIRPREKSQRLMPSSLNNCLAYCIRHKIPIKRQETYFQTTPQLLSSTLDGELILNTPSLLANYCTIDIELDTADEYLLSKLNYVRSSKSKGVYRLIIRTGGELQISTLDLLGLIELLCIDTDEEWRWKGWSKQDVKEIVRSGNASTLFVEESRLLDKEVDW